MAQAALAGTLRRNFQGYTTDAAPVLLGLGASAIGQLPAGYAQNEVDERRWLAAVEAGHLAVVRGRALTAEDRQRRAIIERIMCDHAFDRATVPMAIMAEAAPRLAPLLADGLLAEEGSRLVLTPQGRRFVRHAAACFDAYLQPVAGRHSRAV
jgi:oxygen-independent coproporphyrinogen-3 oxidase